MRATTTNFTPWQQIISSSISRCADFAKELADSPAIPLTLDAQLTEIGFDGWEGKTAAELEQKDKAAFNAFL